MNQKNIKFNYTVAELIEELKKFPQDVPVLVSGYEDGFENIMPLTIQKLTHKPESQYWIGEFQTVQEENEEGLVLQRKVTSKKALPQKSL